MLRTILDPASVMLVAADARHRRRLSAARHRHRAGRDARAANGSLDRCATARRSARALIGQPFSDPKYFWSRPSATSPMPYNAGASSGSNQGPLNPALRRRGRSAHRGAARRPIRTTRAPVPVDLVTASASGLDPHISPAAADTRSRASRRRAACRPERVRALVAEYTRGGTFGLLGEPVVNVLQLNLALDKARAQVSVHVPAGTARMTQGRADDRPDPDALLAALEDEEAHAPRAAS